MSALRKEIGIDEILARIAELQQAVAELGEDRRPEWYTIQQVADSRGQTARTIQRKIALGEIEVVRRHGRRMIHRDHI